MNICKNKKNYICIDDGTTSLRCNYLFNSYYGYIELTPLNATDRPFIITLVDNTSQFIIKIEQNILDTSSTPLNFASLFALDEYTKPGQIVSISGLTTFNSVDETPFNSYYYILSCPIPSNNAYYLVGFNLNYFENGDLCQINKGRFKSIYSVSNLNLTNNTWTLENIGLKSYNYYKPE